MSPPNKQPANQVMKRSSLALRFDQNILEVLDQTQLPQKEVWLNIQTVDDMVTAIQKLSVRGAPLIGVAAVITVAFEALKNKSTEELMSAIAKLRASRPTAVNLMTLLDQLKNQFEKNQFLKQSLIEHALQLFDEDVEMGERMATHMQQYIDDGDHILTHCNTGGLATVGVGTALGGIKRAHELGKKIHVWVDETRPLLHGARLTTWELAKAGVPYTLICDNMAGALFATGKIKKVFVGADRITRDGSAANKIGTYAVAVLAKHHTCPFYVVAPQTTFDPNLESGAQIPIEHRAPEELAPKNINYQCDTWNPAFDVTPAELITKIITD